MSSVDGRGGSTCGATGEYRPAVRGGELDPRRRRPPASWQFLWIDDRDADAGREPQPAIASTDRRRTAQPVQIALQSIGHVIERVLDLIGAIDRDLVHLAMGRTARRPDPELTPTHTLPSSSSTRDGTIFSKGPFFSGQRHETTVLKPAHARRGAHPDRSALS